MALSCAPRARRPARMRAATSAEVGIFRARRFPGFSAALRPRPRA